MLTKNDLKEIQKAMEPVLQRTVEPMIQRAIKPLKQDVSSIRKDVKIIISYFDREYLELRKRIEHIEEHLGITTKN